MEVEGDIAELIKTAQNDELEKLLRNNSSLAEGKTTQGISNLLFAIYCRNKVAVELIRQIKTSLDIYEAVSLGEMEIVSQFLEKQPSYANSFSTDGFTVLGLACFFGHYAVAQVLIEKGSQVNTASKNTYSVTPLHSACAISHFDLAELLLKHGANVNAKQMAGVTPLHEAAHNQQAKLAQLLIQHGADINAKMDNGQTPLYMADEIKFSETAELIRVHGGK